MIGSDNAYLGAGKRTSNDNLCIDVNLDDGAQDQTDREWFKRFGNG